MSTITIFNVIERPTSIVQSAILEVLEVHNKAGNISRLNYDVSDNKHTIKLNLKKWSVNCSNVIMTICLINVDNIGEHTFFVLEFKYSYRANYNLKKFLQKILFRQRLRLEISNSVNQFKYRIEKWL